jgi:hypothetical protein
MPEQDPKPGDAEQPAPEQPATPPPEAPSAPAAPPSPPPRRRLVAFVKRACTIVLGGGMQRLLGGEWITDSEACARLRGGDGLEFLELSTEELADRQREVDAEIQRHTRALADLGRVVYRDGEVTPPKRRG